MCSEAKPVTGPVIIERAKALCDEMKTANKCTFSDGWQQNVEEPAAAGDIQREYHSDYLYSPSMGAVKRNTCKNLVLSNYLEHLII